MDGNRAFSAAAQADPANPDIHFNFGVALEKQGDWAGAAEFVLGSLEGAERSCSTPPGSRSRTSSATHSWLRSRRRWR